MIRARPAMRPFAIAAAWAAATLTALVVLGLAVGAAVGHRSFTVMSGSMEPAIATGDIVVTDRIAPAEARVGQVVSFRDPSGTKKLITHRVRRIRNQGRSFRFTTKGDANNTLERWSVSANGTIGRVWLRIPKLGYVLAQTRTSVGRIVLVVIPALLLGLLELLRIWRPARPSTAPAPAAQVLIRREPGVKPTPAGASELSDDEWLEAWDIVAYRPRAEIGVTGP